MFFALSGFLITGILLRTRDNPAYFRLFYLRRTFRIFPLYYAYLAFVALISLVLARRATALIWDAVYLGNLWTALHGQLDGMTWHLWSLSVEEQFYLVWPLLLFVLPRRWVVPVIVTLLSALAIFRAVAGLEPMAVYAMLHFDGLLLGAFLAVVGQERILWSSLPAALLGAGWLLTGIIHSPLKTLEWHGSQTLNYTAVAICCTWLVAYAARYPESKALTIRPLTEMGKYSYAIYLLHFPIASASNFLYKPTNLPGAGMLALMIGLLSFGSARVTWRYIEAPALEMKERYSERLKQKVFVS